LNAQVAAVAPQPEQPTLNNSAALNDANSQQLVQNIVNYKTAEARKVSPQSSYFQVADNNIAAPNEARQNLSKAVPAEAEFRQLIGNEADGMLARFLQNKLKLMFWHRLGADPDLIFGAQLNLDRVVDGVRGLIQPDPALQNEICLALLDDNAKPVAISRANFQAGWKRPFVATEIGDALPHWEVAAYLVNPVQLTQAARTAKITLGLLVAVLVLAIGVGSWLIVRSLNAELKLARQKTDFVGNVSHELKTPLTSIRMFSELLAEGRVADAAKQRSYLQIITAEAARLTRLINNVLDFSRMERGEKKYNFQPCDLAGVVRGVEQAFRPHLEAGGFKFVCELPDAPIAVRGDADALSQIIVNLLSNAEKYSNGGKEIVLQVSRRESPLPHAEIKVLDRGSGVPRGSGEKIFEKFYRAHDSLASGIQGSGLGLTIARQIARAHGGDVVYEPRDGGGSCFILRLPVSTTDNHG
jgi:signal transduction histidine kinase